MPGSRSWRGPSRSGRLDDESIAYRAPDPGACLLCDAGLAHDERGEFERTIVLPSPREDAVRAVLDAASDAADPIEKRVLDRRPRLLCSAELRSPVARRSRRTATDDGASPGDGQGRGLRPRPERLSRRRISRRTIPTIRRQLAEADVEFSRAVARFVTHIASGRIRPTDISQQITLEPERPDIGEALSRLSQSPDVAADLAGYEPPHPQYAGAEGCARQAPRQRRRRRADRRSRWRAAEARQSDDARRRSFARGLSIASPRDADPKVYDDAAGRGGEGRSRTATGSTPTASSGRSTLQLHERAEPRGGDRLDHRQPRALALDAARPRRLPRHRERPRIRGARCRGRRGRARDAGHRRQADQPDADLLERDKLPDRQSLLERARPRSFSKEMLPEIRADPYGYFARQGYRGLRPRRRPDAAGRSALGRLVFESTRGWCRSARSPATSTRSAASSSCSRISTRSICTTRRRSRCSSATIARFSHGCVRVENPLDFADALLAVAAPKWNSKRLQKLYGGRGAARQPRHAGPGASRLLHGLGRHPTATLRHFDDIYGYDGAMAAYLGALVTKPFTLPGFRRKPPGSAAILP